MKKAKIMLSVLSLCAVVSGALAFKAQKFGGAWRCTSTTTGKCTFSSFTTLGTGTFLVSYCTLIEEPLDAPCVRTLVSFKN